MMKRLFISIPLAAFVFMASFLLLPATPANAAACPDQNKYVFPRWYDDLCDGKGGVMSPADMKASGGADAAETTGRKIGLWILVIVMNCVKILLLVVGYVSLGFIIWGGFKYMTQGDNSGGTAAARKTIQNAVIGLIISIMSISLINFITGAIAA